MKKISLLVAVAAFIFSSISHAQKIDRETIGTYEYTQPPINTALVPYSTYKVEGKGMNADAYRRDIIVNQTYLNGFEKLGEGSDADLRVVVEEYPVTYTESEREEKTNKTKVDGVEKSYKTYWYTCSASYKYVMKVFAKSGEKIYQKEVSGSEAISGSENKNTSEAYKSFKATKGKYHKDITSNKINSLVSTVNDQVGFPKKSASLRTGTVKAKKFKYDDFYKGFDELKKGFEAVKDNEENIEAASASLNEAISVFEEVLKESDIDNKKARVNENVTMLCYANIGISYFLMKDYAKAAEYSTKATELAKMFGCNASIKSKSEDLIKRVAAFEEVTASK